MAEVIIGTGAESAGNTAISLENHPGQHAACDAEIARLRARLNGERDRIAAAVKARADELSRQAVHLLNQRGPGEREKGRRSLDTANGMAEAAALILGDGQ